MPESVNLDRIWQTALGELEVVLSRPNFITWFKHTFIVGIDKDTVTIGVPNSWAGEWLTNKFQPDILQVLRKLLPDTPVKRIVCKIAQQGKTTHPKPNIEPVRERADGPAAAQGNIIREAATFAPNLHATNTFDSFIVGTHNRLAHAASLAVSSEPGKRHNPLFIYGGVGLGKTHLMQAIGHEIMKQDPKIRVLYAPCERFANEFIGAIQNKKTDEFKQKYRNVDVLLIDDIQFLAGKEGTQEEFFHTFNSLHQTNRQIVMTSDRVPQAIPELEARLSSRFVWGMVTDIKNPDLETRTAILKQKCADRRTELTDDVLELIARTFQSNIRELEGGLNQILAYCELEKVQPTVAIIENFLTNHRPERRVQLSPVQVFSVVSGYYKIPTEDLLGPRRHKEFVHPRQVMMYLLRYELNFSFPKIGRELGKDHTTVMHGVGKVERELGQNATLQQEVSLLKEQLYQGA